LPGRLEQPGLLLFAEGAGHGDRRQLRSVQDLIRVGVADPAS
jgi:hypothetical protein